MPISTSHWSLPGFTRGCRAAGSGRLPRSTFLRLLDLFLGAVADEDRLAAPEHLDDLAFGDRRRGRPRSGRRRRSSKRPGSSARSAAPRPRPRRPRPRRRLRCKGNRVESARPKLLPRYPSPSLAGQPFRAGTAGSRGTTRWRSGRPLQSAKPWGRTKSGDPAAFIGTLVKQSASPPVPQSANVAQRVAHSRTNPLHHRVISAIDAARCEAETTACGSPFTSPTSRRTPARFSGSPHASASRPISSSRPGSRPPTAPSAAPAWTISIR